MLDYLGENVQKGVAIIIAIEDVLTPVTARGNKVQRTWERDPDGA